MPSSTLMDGDRVRQLGADVVSRSMQLVSSCRGSDVMNRCDWARNDLAIRYHDEEWGVPVHDDRRWFEFLILEGAQAGLSWDTILRKREATGGASQASTPTPWPLRGGPRSSRCWPTPASCETGSRSPRQSRTPVPS